MSVLIIRCSQSEVDMLVTERIYVCVLALPLHLSRLEQQVFYLTTALVKVFIFYVCFYSVSEDGISSRNVMKKIASLTWVFLFLHNLRFNRPLSQVIKSNYGLSTLQHLRRLQKLQLQRDKSLCDLEFLRKLYLKMGFHPETS